MSEDKVSRFPLVESRGDLPEDQRHNWDRVADSRGGVGRTFATLLNSPELGGRVAFLGTYIRFEGILPGDDRELAILTVAREFKSAYEWVAHEPIAREEGVSETTIDALAKGTSLDDIPDDDVMIIRYGQKLFNDHSISEATFESLLDRYGVEGAIELTITIGYYGMLACVHNAVELRADGQAPWQK